MEWLIPYKIDEETPPAVAAVAPSTFAGPFLQGCRRIAASTIGWVRTRTTPRASCDRRSGKSLLPRSSSITRAASGTAWPGARDALLSSP
jgi:hypothetical protein